MHSKLRGIRQEYVRHSSLRIVLKQGFLQLKSGIEDESGTLDTVITAHLTSVSFPRCHRVSDRYSFQVICRLLPLDRYSEGNW